MSTVLNTINDLRDYDPSQSDSAVVEKYSTASGEKGGGHFIWKDGDDTDADDGTVFESEVSGYGPGEANEGRWHRTFDGVTVRVSWFNVSSANDASAALQHMVDLAGRGVLVIDEDVRAEGIILNASQHTGLTVRGENGARVLKPTTPSDDTRTFTTNPSDPPDNVSWINVWVENADLSDGDIGNNTMENRDAWRIEGSPKGWRFEGCRAKRIKGLGFHCGSAESVTLLGCIAERTARDGFYFAEGGRCRWIDCESLWAGRHNFTVAGDPEETYVEMVGCYAKDSYWSGFDMEQGRRVHIDSVFEGNGRDGVGSTLAAGINFRANTEHISGHARVYNPAGYVAELRGKYYDDFTVSYERPVGSGSGTEVDIYGPWSTLRSGTLTINGRGGGNNQAVNVDARNGLILNVNVRDTQGRTLRVQRSSKCIFNVVSINPDLADSGDFEESCHIFLDTVGGIDVEDCTFDVVAMDENGNVMRGIQGSSTARCVFRGNLNGAWTNHATGGSIGSQGDITDQLIS